MDRDILAELEATNNLPTLPAVAMEVIRVCRDPGCQISDLLELIQHDPSLTTKVLRTVNSAMFGLSRRVTSLKQALTLLGLESVRAIVLSFSLVKLQGPKTRREFDFRRYWKQFLTNAVSARELCVKHQLGMPEEAFVAGLLQDIGILALVQAVPDRYEHVLVRIEESDVHRIVAEREVLDTDHMEVGSWLADRWGLPLCLCTPIAYHHEPHEYLGTDDRVSNLIRVLHASSLIGELFYDHAKSRPKELLAAFLAGEFSMSAEAMDELLLELKAKVTEAADALDMEIEPPQDYGSILAEANAELARLSVLATRQTSLSRAREVRLQERNQDLERERRRLHDQAVRDRMTGVFNRAFFDELLAKEYRRGMRYHRRVGLIFLDLDHFKVLNDTYGHPFGDTILCEVARALSDGTRESDVVARYGGEEFVVLAVEPTEASLQQLAERLRSNVSDMLPSVDGKTVRVTVSVGAAICQPRRGGRDGERHLLECADKAMYQAKEAGRDRVCFVSLLADADRQVGAAIEAMRFSRFLVRKGVVDKAAISKALCTKTTKRFKSGYLAVQLGMLGEAQLYEILDEQARTNRRFGEIAVGRGLLSARQVFWLLAVQKEDPEALGAALVAARTITPQRLRREIKKYTELAFHDARLKGAAVAGARGPV